MPPPPAHASACLLALFAFGLVPIPVGAAPPVDAVVVFNEVSYHPTDPTGSMEWVELHNQMGINIDLSDGEISGGVNYTFPDNTVISGGGYLVVALQPAQIAGALGPWTGRLANSNETIRLRDKNGRLLDELSYDDDSPWPLAPDGGGVTLAKRLPDRASVPAAEWTWSAQAGGTPGTENFPPPPAPVVTQPSGLGSTWKFTQTEPFASWTEPAFSDTAWSTGQALFSFGNPVLHDPRPPGTPDQNAEITGVSILDVSSEASSSGLSRAAINVLNSSGLSSGRHGTTANNTMWLTNGTLLTPGDPLPAQITFDFGASRRVSALRVWNYNENAGSDLSTRGTRQVEIFTATTPGGTFTSVGNFEFPRASGTAGEEGDVIPFAQVLEGVRQIRFVITTNWGATNQFTGLSEVRFLSDEPPAPPRHRQTISQFANTGTDTPTGKLLPIGSDDPNYFNVAANRPAIVQAGNAAWAGADGLSQWLGSTASGNDAAPAGLTTYRLNVDLSGWNKDTAQVRLSALTDNTLDRVRLNGLVLSGVNGSNFTTWLGPFTVSPGGLLPGTNVFEFDWTNTGTAPNPAGFRARWDATAEPRLLKTTLASNAGATWLRQKFTASGAVTSNYRFFLEHIVDDGAVFYLNGTEILRVNLPSGPLTTTTPATGDVEFPTFSGLLELPSAPLIRGENTLAVRLHQATGGTAGAVFGARVQVVETASPDTAPLPVRFDEIASAVSPAGGFFVELQNTGTSSLTLNNLSLRSSGGQTRAVPPASLAPGARVVLDETPPGFRPGDGEKLFLVAGSGAVLDAVEVKNRGQARLTGTGAWQTATAPSPGTPSVFEIPSSIVISEIMYHHAPVFLPTGTTEDSEEWIELHNRSSQPVSLEGWKLRGDADYDFAPGTAIAPGGYLVVCRSAAALLARHPAVNAVGDWTGSLPNSGATIRLEDPAQNTADEVTFLDAGRWPAAADGGGSSLELLHPDMDNSLPESWAASNETAKAQWQTFTYSGPASPPAGSNDPTLYNEFIAGLLNDGTCLLDDVSVINTSSGNAQVIQDGGFTAGNASKWRLIGTHGAHGESGVINEAGNPALRLTATGPTEHMHNHAGTTLRSTAGYVTMNASHVYTISFRAKWQSGCPRLNTRLYFNRLSRQHLLPMPVATGTPGTGNSRVIAAPRLALSQLGHTPVIPTAGEAATVRVHVGTAATSGTVSLLWRPDPLTTWNETAMSPGPDGFHTGLIPGQAAGTLVQFYVRATTAGGAQSLLPAAGPAARAMIRWSDNILHPGPGHGLRILMPVADSDWMHGVTNVMSNHYLPCTIIYRDRDVFYNASVRLRSSQRGRFGDARLGFAIQFDPLNPFRGSQQVINLDRSAYSPGTDGSGTGQVDIINQIFAQRAGGVPAMYNDMVHLIAPRSVHNGSAQMTMAEFNDIYFDSQYDKGADFPTFKLDLIYFPTTQTGGIEGLKNAQPDNVAGVNIGAYTGVSKEDYRWNFIIGNARSNDDYSRLIFFNDAFRRLTSGDSSRINDAIDVDQWLRASAAMSLVNSNDSYSTGGLPHNLKLGVRSDGRVLYLPWDADFFKMPANHPVAGNSDLQRLLAANPVWRRWFYGHLRDLIQTSHNVTWLTPWVTHLSAYSTARGDWNDILTYVRDRNAFVQSAISTQYPNVTFAITTNDGNPFSTSQSTVALTGDAWINVRSIRLQGSTGNLVATWTGARGWSVSVPVAPGQNPFVIEALDHQGSIVGSDSITITGTGLRVPASADNVVISQFHYHPSAVTASEINAGYQDRNDFEYFELMNIGSETIDLGNCRFDAGLTYTFAANTTLAPGARLVVPRRTAAFALRHPGVPTAAQYYDPLGGNLLSNGGETLALLDATGTDMKRFTYGDNLPWPPAADGTGPALHLIAPAGNPAHSFALNWRAAPSTPGSGLPTPPPPAAPLADANQDGLADLINYAAGGSPNITSGQEGLSFERDARVSTAWTFERSPDHETWQPFEPSVTARETLPDHRERLTFATPSSAPATFLRLRVRLR